MRENEIRTDYDVARALKNEQGTFLVQRAGHTSVVTAQQGHSISSWRALGAVEPTSLPSGSNPPYVITKISDNILPTTLDQATTNQQQQGGERRFNQ